MYADTRMGAVMLRKAAVLVAVLLMLLLVSGCVAGPNDLADTPDEQGDVAGFWSGLWNGFIVLFTFVASLFWDDVGIYDVHNSGGWYDFGFVLGVMIFFGGSGGGVTRGARGR